MAGVFYQHVVQARRFTGPALSRALLVDCGRWVPNEVVRGAAHCLK